MFTPDKGSAQESNLDPIRPYSKKIVHEWSLDEPRVNAFTPDPVQRGQSFLSLSRILRFASSCGVTSKVFFHSAYFHDAMFDPAQIVYASGIRISQIISHIL